MLEKILESPLDSKEIKPVNPKGNQSWIFTRRTDAEAEAPMLWPPNGKNWLIGKDPDAGKDWRQEEKGTTENEMLRWHHQHNGQEFEQSPGLGDEQGSLACCGPWGYRVGHNRVTKHKAGTCSYRRAYYIFFIHSSVDGHLSCFRDLVHVSFQIRIFVCSDYMPRNAPQHF